MVFLAELAIFFMSDTKMKKELPDTEARRIQNKLFRGCCIKHTPESPLERGFYD